MSSFKVELRLIKRDPEDDSLQSTVTKFVDVPADEKVKHFKLKALRRLLVRKSQPDYLDCCTFMCGPTTVLHNEDNDKTCAEVGLADKTVVRVLLMFPDDGGALSWGERILSLFKR